MNNGRTIESLGANARHADRNHRLGLLAGMFAVTARDFLHPQLILAGLVYALTRSTMLVALMAIIDKAGMLFPQLLVSSLFEHVNRRRPLFVLVTVLRVGSYALLVGSIWLLTMKVDSRTLAVFFVAFTLTRLTSAFSIVLFTDMTGRLIDPARVGSFIGMRHFLGGAVSVLTGFLVVQPILARLDLPLNYLVLSVIGLALLTIDMSIWCQCREEPGPRARKRTSFAEALGRGMQWLKTDHNYRCYLVHRVGFRIAFVGLAFFIPYGERELATAAGPAGLALLGGVLVATLKLSQTVGSLLWGRLADIFGFRAALAYGGAFHAAATLAALSAPLLPAAFALPLPLVEGFLTLPLIVYLAALLFLGFGFQAAVIGGRQFLINNAPEDRRASYLAFINTISAPLTLLPLAAAVVADNYGMRVLFAGVVAGGLLELAAAAAMYRR